jgi:predicted TIM-barrel fold metal-dependent hydrolase
VTPLDPAQEDAMEGEWIISVDDHAYEPADLWTSRLPEAWTEAAPRLVRDEQGEAWVYDGKRVPTPGLNALARRDEDGRIYEEMAPDALTYAEMRESCFDPRARIIDMNRDGVVASLCFPSFPRFCGQVFLEAADKDLALLCVRAYNDWMIEEWCGYEPGRLVPLVILPLWDIGLCVAEIERCARRGVHALTFSENPSKLGLPSLYDRARHWDPVIAAAVDAEMVVCTHIGSSSWVQRSAPDANLASAAVWGTASNAHSTLVDWIMSGMLVRFPRARIALSEGGIGWVPYYLERLDRWFHRHRHWSTSRRLVVGTDGSGNPNVGRLATGESEVNLPLDFDVRQCWRENFLGCAIADTDSFGLTVGIDAIGVENIAVETDFPHADTSWPNSINMLRTALAHLAPDVQYKIRQGNARRVFHIDTPEPRAPSAGPTAS